MKSSGGKGRRRRTVRPNKSAAGGFGHWLTEAVAAVLTMDMPADQALHYFFRQHKAIGRRDRGLIADRCFDVLRQRRWFGHLAESGVGPLPRRLALLSDASMDRQVLSATETEREWLSHIDLVDKSAVSVGLRVSLPDWLIEQLTPTLGEPGIGALGESLLRPAPLDLRANLIKTKAGPLVEQLAEQGIEARLLRPDFALAPETAVRVRGHPALEKSAAFQQGLFEVQDVGSQLVAAIAAPKRGDTVVDFCAGAGGKTLAMAAMMRSRGQIYACDIASRRLARMTPRLSRSGATNVQPMRLDSEHDKRLGRLRGRAHVVLVDAPCSGTGTLRRNPDLKWRHSMIHVNRLASQQGSILTAASALVRPGGRLVYATCSLLDIENEQVARAFEAENPAFERVNLAAPAAHARDRPSVARENSGFLRLWPHLDDADGFFVAVWTLKPA